MIIMIYNYWYIGKTMLVLQACIENDVGVKKHDWKGGLSLKV